MNSGGNGARPPLTLEDRVTQLEEVVAGLVLRIDSQPAPPPPPRVLAIVVDAKTGQGEVQIPQDARAAHQLLASLTRAVEEAHGRASGLLLPS